MVGTTTIAAKPTVGSVQQSSLFHLKVLSLPRLSMDASMPVMQSEISAAYGRPAAHIGKIKNSDHQLCSVEPFQFFAAYQATKTENACTSVTIGVPPSLPADWVSIIPTLSVKTISPTMLTIQILLRLENATMKTGISIQTATDIAIDCRGSVRP